MKVLEEFPYFDVENCSISIYIYIYTENVRIRYHAGPLVVWGIFHLISRGIKGKPAASKVSSFVLPFWGWCTC